MPGGGIQSDMLSGIEEESDMYEGFAPHVDYTNIPISSESSPGESIQMLITDDYFDYGLSHLRHTSYEYLMCRLGKILCLYRLQFASL